MAKFRLQTLYEKSCHWFILNEEHFEQYSMVEQVKIINNFFAALRNLFKDEWTDNTFFKTIGFGAMFNMFDEIFQITHFGAKGLHGA